MEPRLSHNIVTIPHNEKLNGIRMRLVFFNLKTHYLQKKEKQNIFYILVPIVILKILYEKSG